MSPGTQTVCLRPGIFYFPIAVAVVRRKKKQPEYRPKGLKKQYFVNFYVLHKFYGEFRVKLKQRVSGLQKIVETLQKEKAAL